MRNARIKLMKSMVVVSVALAMTSCVSTRPLRTTLDDSSAYLDKKHLTDAPEGRADNWLFQVTVVEASAPNIARYVFPGQMSSLKAVNFRFTEDSLQVVDGLRLQSDQPNNPNDDLSTQTARVIMEFPGEHIDVRLRETLNGELTNLIEENKELPWSRRQTFKAEFEDVNMDPVASIAWFYGDQMAACAKPVATNLVPGSFEEPEENVLNFALETTYALTATGGCWDMVSMATDTGTASIRYQFSFYRPEARGAGRAYEPEFIEEKDPVNKKYGAFQRFSFFRDAETGLLDARSMLQRWDPNREEPVVFYLQKGFPDRFRPMFEEIKADTNRIMEEAGAKLRFDFRDWNDGGIERRFGDVRYSFVVWHQEIDTTQGLLGYGPSSSDPQTGEVISANLNLYNVGMDRYRFLIQDYLEDLGAAGSPEPVMEDGKLVQPTCTLGEEIALKGDRSQRLNTGLFSWMRRTMELPPTGPPGQDPTAAFLPKPVRADFLQNYLRVLPELRYVRPEWNDYVASRTRSPRAGFEERLKVEREFNQAMESILMNENPFGPVDLSARGGIEAMNAFADKFRTWRQNHEALEADWDMLLSRHNVHLFDSADAYHAIRAGSRRCVADAKGQPRWESDEQYRERIIESVVYNVAIHELGHNLSLRHNFYGSVDHAHHKIGAVSSSVMDYVRSQMETAAPRGWGPYDEAALKWIYGTKEVRKAMMAEDFLYCTDQHRSRSPLCTAHDLGITPSQIVLNAIEQYEWAYKHRNRRSYRRFWDTSAYASQVYSAIFPLQRMWHLARFDWAGEGVQEILKRLDELDPKRKRLTDAEYDAIARDFKVDVGAAVDLSMAFYDAVVNQPAGSRPYQTEFDPYYGDVLRMGIVVDKLYSTFAFVDLQNIFNYDPNIQTYAAMYDGSVDSKGFGLSQRILDRFLGSSYATFPWFKFTAMNLFAAASNSNLINNLALKERMAIERYENRMEFEAVYGPETLSLVNRPNDNPSRTFEWKGESYIYAYIADQEWHLVASQSRSPVSYQFIRDFNEDISENRGSLDNYDLKTLLSYYEFYNNFVGF